MDLHEFANKVNAELEELRAICETIPRGFDGGGYKSEGGTTAQGVIQIYEFKLSPEPDNHTDPEGAVWKKCDGASYTRASFASAAAKASLWSWPYGSGNGTTTFNVADFRDRFVLMPGYQVTTVGATEGRALNERSPVTHSHAAGTLSAANASVPSGMGLQATGGGEPYTDEASAQIGTHGVQSCTLTLSHNHGFVGAGGNGTVASGSDLDMDFDSGAYSTQSMDHTVNGHSHGLTGVEVMGGGAHAHSVTGSTASKTAWPAYGTGNWFQRVA